ncbi:MAG: hypothetical protein AAFX54_03210 [Pseudomonadota bacterium]
MTKLANKIQTAITAGVLAALSATSSFARDATSSLPHGFANDLFMTIDGPDFCARTRNKSCIEISIHNDSRATLDWKDSSNDGSLTGSGALQGFQIIEAAGCVSGDDLISPFSFDTDKDILDKHGRIPEFTRRMKEDTHHYWKPGAVKKAKLIKGCAYAVGVERELDKGKWHLTYVPPRAKQGCYLRYKYVVTKADIKEYEKWATFGAVGGGIASVIGGMGAAPYAFYATMTDTGAVFAESGSALTADAAAAAGAAGATAGLYVVGATAVYESGVWGAYGIDVLIRTIDGDRDWLLGGKCS